MRGETSNGALDLLGALSTLIQEAEFLYRCPCFKNQIPNAETDLITVAETCVEQFLMKP